MRATFQPAILALLVALVAGCGSMPALVPDLSLRSSRSAVQLDGPAGPLSAKQSEAVLARLARQGEETAIFERHLAFEERIAGSPLVTGNRVTLLQDGPATFQAMFDAIGSAKDHVHLETYAFEDDEVGRRFADALLAKQAAGVPVSVLYDSVGSINTPKAFFARLADGGVKVLEFNPINPLTAKKGWDVNRRDHRKLLVVDGRIAFVGGINISSVYSGGSFSHGSKQRPGGAPPWRDTHVRIEGPVVAELQKLFLGSWEKQKGGAVPGRNLFPPPVTAGREVVRAIGSSPDEPLNLIYATLVSAIRSAETSVHITVAYFVPDPQLLETLEDAAGRGVDVRLILPGHTDFWAVFHAGRSHYAPLLEAGVRIHERRGALLHAKSAVVDGVWSTIGSTNLDWRSFLNNDEVNVVVLGQSFGAQMRAMFEADLAASELVTVESWGARPLSDRAKELAARLWARLL
jgi:cardiolipin synthase